MVRSYLAKETSHQVLVLFNASEFLIGQFRLSGVGEAQTYVGLPVTDSNLTSETWTRRERSHHDAGSDQRDPRPEIQRTTIRALFPR